MFRALSLCTLLAAAVAHAAPLTSPLPTSEAAPEPTLPPDARLQGGTRHDRAGWVYLHLQGTATQRGFQHGYLLHGEIARSLEARRVLWHHGSGLQWSWLVQRARTVLLPRVDAEILQEIDGIVAGMAARGQRTTRDELIAYNGYFELEGYYWPKAKKKLESEAPGQPKQACSAFIATGKMTRDGGVVLGHNTMFPYPEADANVVIDLVPDRGHRILMQAFPGWIHSGTDFFLTDAGLVGAETTLGGFNKFDEKGVPEFVRFRRATQDAGSIDEWVAIMRRGNNGGYANAWLLGDVKSGEIARLELGLRHVQLERTRDGYYAGSNVAEDLGLLRFETDDRETDIRRSGAARRVRWKQLMRESAGRIDTELAKRLEADHFDVYLGRDNPSGRTLCSHAHEDPQLYGAGLPYSPSGTFDVKVVDTRLARALSFEARFGSACGAAFDAVAFLKAHPQFDWMEGILRSRPTQPWTTFKAGE